jgi:hypothetical protein
LIDKPVDIIGLSAGVVVGLYLYCEAAKPIVDSSMLFLVSSDVIRAACSRLVSYSDF